jgi:hypothetical protein
MEKVHARVVVVPVKDHVLVVIVLKMDAVMMAVIVTDLVAAAATASRGGVGRQQGGADRHSDYETDRGRLHLSSPGK